MSIFSIGSNFGFASAQQQASATAVKPADKRSNEEIRQSYNVQISSAYQDKFKAKFQEFHDNDQCFGEDLAREAFETRTAIKKAHQSESSWLGQAAIWIRNMVTYGAGNVDYDFLSKKKNPEEIAYGAFKTGGGNLGLENNGFGETLDVWNAIKNASTLYPEDITPSMLEAYRSQVDSKAPHKLDVNAILAMHGAGNGAAAVQTTRISTFA